MLGGNRLAAEQSDLTLGAEPAVWGG